MPSTRDIRRRIKSVKNTAQITKAMQMVASSKMRKAQLAALAGRPYAVLMNEVLTAVSANAGDFSHPLLESRPVKKRALIVISTDKGLCGALNANLFRAAAQFDLIALGLAERILIRLVAIGLLEIFLDEWSGYVESVQFQSRVNFL